MSQEVMEVDQLKVKRGATEANLDSVTVRFIEEGKWNTIQYKKSKRHVTLKGAEIIGSKRKTESIDEGQIFRQPNLEPIRIGKETTNNKELSTETVSSAENKEALTWIKTFII